MPGARPCPCTASLNSGKRQTTLCLTRFHGVFAPNFKHRDRIVPQRAQRAVEGDKPVAPMSWPFSHLPVLHGTGTSCPMDAAAQAGLRYRHCLQGCR
jgi:hypothetical protein